MLRSLRFIPALFVLGLFTPSSSPALGEAKIEAGSCAIATGASATGNTITCNFDMPPEKLKELIEAALKGGEPQRHVPL